MKIKKFAAFLTAAALALQPPAVSAENSDGTGSSVSAPVSAKFTGKYKSGGSYYYYQNGKLVTGEWVIINGKKRYYAKEDGTLAVGKTTVDGIEYTFDKTGRFVDSAKGVTLLIKDVSPAGLTLRISSAEKDPDTRVYTDPSYTVQRYDGTEWTDVEYLNGEPPMWPDNEQVIRETDDGTVCDGVIDKLDWSGFYGELPDGRYRVVKNIGICRGEDTVREKYYAYFDAESVKPVTGEWKTRSDGKYFYLPDGAPASGSLTIGGIEYEFDRNGKLYEDEWGIKMNAKDVTPFGMTLEICRFMGSGHTDSLQTGSYYKIQRFNGREWENLKYATGESTAVWTAEAYLLESDSADMTYSPVIEDSVKLRFDINWLYLYDELPDGHYRLCKQITACRAPGSSTDKYYYAYFDITDSSKTSDGWWEIDGKTYFFKPQGDMATGLCEIDGVLYDFGGDGVCRGRYDGWVNALGGREYFELGRIVKNRLFEENAVTYYADENGVALPAAVFRVTAPDGTEYESLSCGRSWSVDGKRVRAPKAYFKMKPDAGATRSNGFTTRYFDGSTKEHFPVKLSEGFSVELFNSSDTYLWCGVEYKLEYFENGEWRGARYEDKSADYAFNCIGITVPSGSSYTQNLSFEIYEKNAGRYRLTKTCQVGGEEFTCVVEFSAVL